MSLEEYKEDTKDLILAAMMRLDPDEYEEFSEFVIEALRGQV